MLIRGLPLVGEESRSGDEDCAPAPPCDRKDATGWAWRFEIISLGRDGIRTPAVVTSEPVVDDGTTDIIAVVPPRQNFQPTRDPRARLFWYFGWLFDESGQSLP